MMLPSIVACVFPSRLKNPRLITSPCLSPSSMLNFSPPCQALNQCEFGKSFMASATEAWGALLQERVQKWLKVPAIGSFERAFQHTVHNNINNAKTWRCFQPNNWRFIPFCKITTYFFCFLHSLMDGQIL